MDIDVYCDEAYPDLFSSKNPQAKYLIIGSLWLRTKDRETFKEKIHNLRDQLRFRKSDFDHAFFESKNAKDDTFSMLRAERMDWIKTALKDPNSDRFVGWNNRLKRYDNRRRVTVALRNYVVIMGFTNKGAGFFITAFVADSDRTLSLIRKGPRWA